METMRTKLKALKNELEDSKLAEEALRNYAHKLKTHYTSESTTEKAILCETMADHEKNFRKVMIENLAGGAYEN